MPLDLETLFFGQMAELLNAFLQRENLFFLLNDGAP